MWWGDPLAVAVGVPRVASERGFGHLATGGSPGRLPSNTQVSRDPINTAHLKIDVYPSHKARAIRKCVTCSLANMVIPFHSGNEMRMGRTAYIVFYEQRLKHN